MYKAIFLFGLLVVAATEQDVSTPSIPGGYKDVDITDEDVVKASQQLSKRLLGRYHHKLVKVLKAKTQVVAGLNYQLDLIVGMTDCKKREVAYDEVDKCGFQDKMNTYKKCTAFVYKDLRDNYNLIAYGWTLISKNDI